MAAAKWFEIVTELRYPADAASLKKALSGTWEGALNWKTVYPGNIVNDIPPEVADALLASGDIKSSKVPPKIETEEKEG